MVAQPAEKSCAESVQPFLASILEELMGPVSSGFSEVRSLFEKEVDELSQNFQTTKDSTQLKEVRRQAEELSENGLPEATRVLPSCPSPALPFTPLVFLPCIWSRHSSIYPPDFLINAFRVAKIIACMCQ